MKSNIFTIFVIVNLMKIMGALIKTGCTYLLLWLLWDNTIGIETIQVLLVVYYIVTPVELE